MRFLCSLPILYAPLQNRFGIIVPGKQDTNIPANPLRDDNYFFSPLDAEEEAIRQRHPFSLPVLQDINSLFRDIRF